MADGIKVAVAVGILLLAVALFVPTLADSVNTNNADTHNLSVNETQELTDKLEVELLETGTNNTNNATVLYRNLDTLNSSQTTLNISTNDKVTVDGEDITVELKSATNTTATIESNYDPKFGWNDGAVTFFEESDTLIVGLAMVIVIGLFAAVARMIL